MKTIRKHHELPVASHVTELVETLQEGGFETYIVGGAIRDLLLNRRPKDYDISTAATPEEVRAVFGRRQARIIGKRFQLVHVTFQGELFEVSTFRRAPEGVAERDKPRAGRPENMIFSDNDFGTSEEDAWRRDFTVNALFYDPAKGEIIDHTGEGLADIERRAVRAIGDPRLRFEEDPVRMLRALKLVGQYDFSLDTATENALFSSLPLIRHASTSRLSLELEKVLASAYGDRHLVTFHDYGFLHYFLPALDGNWSSPAARYAVDLLATRNDRISAGEYRNSISVAVAALALPFIEERLGRNPGELWDENPVHAHDVILAVLDGLFAPQQMVRRMMESAEQMLRLQPALYAAEADNEGHVLLAGAYSHARELLMIQNDCFWQRDDLEECWPPGHGRNRTPRVRRRNRSSTRERSRRGGRRGPKAAPFSGDDE